MKINLNLNESDLKYLKDILWFLGDSVDVQLTEIGYNKTWSIYEKVCSKLDEVKQIKKEVKHYASD